MLADVTMLRYWKSEHDEGTCEDACDAHIEDGLFAVADGAGSTLFSDAWATLLVKHFMHVPLMNSDPFEVEWWLREAQREFKKTIPMPENMPWNALQKMQSQGSHATLATLRVSAYGTEQVTAELLAFGDSCIFVCQPSSEQIFSFPLKHADDFVRAPICLPSKSGLFNRYFHRCQVATVELKVGDVVVIATDAVARWIMSNQDQKKALQEVAQQSTSSWPSFIHACRNRQEMVDDDSTALILTLSSDSADRDTLPLGTTVDHSPQVREQRVKDFKQAQQEHNQEQIALSIGDGKDLHTAGLDINQDIKEYARRVSDALREVLAILRQEANNQEIRAIMTAAWQKQARLLYAEPCAANLRTTLKRLGVLLDPVITSPTPTVEELPRHDDEPTMLNTNMMRFDNREIPWLPQVRNE